jgi:mono/diheme cytochrome c family protein
MRTIYLLAATPLVALAGASLADSPAPTMSPGFRISEPSGEAIYANICQACHMSKGEGAVGAGRYPALARNENLRSSGFVLTLVLNGHKAMPPFGRLMTDDQVAAVANYVRTHFGNDYTDAITAQDVKNAR